MPRTEPAAPARRPSRRRFLQLAGAALGSMAPLLSACQPALPYVVEIHDEEGYRPGSVTVPRGSTVRWKNVGVAPPSATDDPSKAHTPTDAALPPGAAPWDSGPLYAGQAWSVVLETPGRYTYFSTLDEGLTGTVTVTG
jgi:plastocyanin